MRKRIKEFIESGTSEKPHKVHPNSLANLKGSSKTKIAETFDPRKAAKGKPLTEALQHIVEEQAFDMAWALVSKAKRGDVNAFREVADRTEGPVVERVETTHLNLAVIIQKARARVKRAELRDGSGVIDAEVVEPGSQGRGATKT